MVEPRMSQPLDPPVPIAAPMVRASAPACTSGAEWMPPRNWAYERQGPWMLASAAVFACVPRRPAFQDALPIQAAPVGDDTPSCPFEGDETPPVPLEGDVTPPSASPLTSTTLKSAPVKRQRSVETGTRAKPPEEAEEAEEEYGFRGFCASRFARVEEAAKARASGAQPKRGWPVVPVVRDGYEVTVEEHPID